MKSLVLFVLGLCILSSAAWAGTYTYVPVPANLDNLYHPSCYSWTIDLSSKGFDPTKENIVSATVNFHQINNWQAETNFLYVALMDPTASDLPGVNTYSDVVSGMADDWTAKDAGNHWKLLPASFTNRLDVGSYSDTDGHYGDAPPYSDVPIGFSAGALTSLNTFASDKFIAIGFDPDCHYYNSGIDLTIATTNRENAPVPEPMSIMLGVLGLASVAGIRRFRGTRG